MTSPVSRYFMAYRTETSGQYWTTQDYGALKVVEEQGKIAEIDVYKRQSQWQPAKARPP